MSLIESLTPKNTEELKPGLFIQRRAKGYKQIDPLAWNGKYRWREQLKTIFCLRTIVFLAIILLLFYGYKHDTQKCYEMIEDPITYCRGIVLVNPTLSNIEEEGFLKEDEINYTIPSNS